MRAFNASVIELKDVPNMVRRVDAHIRRALHEHPVEIVIRRLLKTRPQEKHYHALIGDIADQYRHKGRSWEREDMKRLMVDAFWYDTRHDPDLAEAWSEVSALQLAPAIGRDGFVALGLQTRRFSKVLAIAFIEWLYAFGNENGVRWTASSLAAMEQYREAA